jgi:hypothetical protein
MHYVSKGGPPRGRTYLACDNARRKHTCNAKSVRYDMITNGIMNSLDARDLDLRGLLSNGSAQSHQQEISYRIEAIGGQIDELKEGTVNLLNVLSRRPLPAIEARLAENESTLTQLREERTSLEAELHNTEYSSDHLEVALQAWSDVKRTVEKGTDEEAGEVRVRLNGALKRLISKIEIGKVSENEYKSTFPMWQNFQKLQDYVKIPLLPITVNFTQDNRHLLIYANPKNYKEYWYVGVKVDDTGIIQKFRFGPITADLNALLWPEISRELPKVS